MSDNSAFFYAYSGLVDSINPEWLQWLFNATIRLFKIVFLWEILIKKVSVVCHPYPISRRHSTSSYGKIMTGKGLSH